MQLLGLSAAVPGRSVLVRERAGEFGAEVVEKIVGNTGIEAFRVAEGSSCTSDLAFVAADRLLDQMGWNRNRIDGLLLLTQTPDYLLVPATSPSLQHRLGLPTSTFTLDINQGCTGFTAGLMTAASLLTGLELDHVLLLLGDTHSKIIDPSDQASALLFGDAAAAVLLARDAQTGLAYSCGTDGSGADLLAQPFGYRHGLSVDAEPNRPSHGDLALRMDGARIFQFTIFRVVAMVQDLLDKAQLSIEEIDYFVFHQANAFILSYLAKKLKIPPEKVPVGLTEFGNTAGASIPLTLVTQLPTAFADSPKKCMFIGFGAGLAWSAVILDIHRPAILPLIETQL